tara:strand:+ start:49 stop:261 length:213 start_codon:yes stop_codon:yes gene_type:complete
VAEEAIQNNSIADSAVVMEDKFVNKPEKTRGANTKLFLIHCFGRINLISPITEVVEFFFSLMIVCIGVTC